MRAFSPFVRSRRAGPRRGQALVEFALVLPILLLLILGLVDLARAWNTYQVLTDAAREGARTAVIDDSAITEPDVRAVISAAMTRASLEETNATVTITGFDSGRGNPTTVRIEYPYRFGLIGGLVALAQGSQTITLTTEIVMRNE